MIRLNAIRFLMYGAAAALLLSMPAFSMLLLTAPQDEALGKQVYEKQCKMCHGEDAKGQTKAGQMTKTPDLTETPWKHGTSQEEVEKLTREGAGKMKGYETKLSAEEIAAVAYYTRKLAGVIDENQ